MKDKKIILCTTFRDFTGSENDAIQEMFLKSIENQTYKNYKLVVALFGEKNVEKEVGKYKFKCTFYNNKVYDCKYSLTELLLNCYEENLDNSIIIWTTCDIILDPHFFEQVIHYTKGKSNFMGTSHPHVEFLNMEAFKANRVLGEHPINGIDLIFFDHAFLNNSRVKRAIKEYPNKEWGYYEHFLVALNELVPKCSMINLYMESKIGKIYNDRELLNESNAFLSESRKKNELVFKNFLYDFSINKNYWNLYYCHSKFKPGPNFLKYSMYTLEGVILYFFHHLLIKILPPYLVTKLRNIRAKWR